MLLGSGLLPRLLIHPEFRERNTHYFFHPRFIRANSWPGRRIIADESECLGGVWHNWLAHWVMAAGLRVCLLIDVFLHPNTALERAPYGHVHSKGLLCQSLSILRMCLAKGCLISAGVGQAGRHPFSGSDTNRAVHRVE